MSEFKELIDSAQSKPNSDSIMNYWGDIFDYYLDIIKEKDKNLYCDIISELYVSINGEHLSKELAIKAVKSMQNADGTRGEHWEIDETTKQAEKYGVNWKNYNEYDFYYVMNMLYSDFYKLFNNDTDTYTKMSIEWLNDKDVEPGKAYRYYNKVVKVN